LQLRIGGGTGALIGGVAGRVVGDAVAGGIGAAAGAIIADARRPGRCYYYTRKGYGMRAALEARGVFLSNART
jgi:hypothetical protein